MGSWSDCPVFLKGLAGPACNAKFTVFLNFTDGWKSGYWWPGRVSLSLSATNSVCCRGRILRFFLFSVVCGWQSKYSNSSKRRNELTRWNEVSVEETGRVTLSSPSVSPLPGDNKGWKRGRNKGERVIERDATVILHRSPHWGLSA